MITLAGATAQQLFRMKLWVLVGSFSLVTVIVGYFFPTGSPEQQLKLLKDVSLGAVQIFALILAVASGAILLPKDIEDRTLYILLTKPLYRWQYILGRWLGIVWVLILSLMLMDVLFSSVIYLKEKEIHTDIVAIYQQKGMQVNEDVIIKIQQQGMSWDFQGAVGVIILKSSVLAAIVIFLSCFATSTLFSILVGFFIYGIGHMHEWVKEWIHFFQWDAWFEDLVLNVVYLALPDWGRYDLSDFLLQGKLITWLVYYELIRMTLVYICWYLFWASWVFQRKEF
jgi:hypothetical protein